MAGYTSLIFTCCTTYQFRKVLARRRWNFGVTFEARYADKTARSQGLLAKNAVKKALTRVRIFQVKALHDTVGRVRIAAENRQALFQEIAIRAVNLGRHISIHRCLGLSYFCIRYSIPSLATRCIGRSLTMRATSAILFAAGWFLQSACAALVPARVEERSLDCVVKPKIFIISMVCYSQVLTPRKSKRFLTVLLRQFDPEATVWWGIDEFDILVSSRLK